VSSVLQSALWMLVLFVCSAGLAYVLTSFGRRRRIELPTVRPNTSLRLVGPGGVYRCYLIRTDREALVVSAPLHRDHFVPLRPEERLMVQMPVQDGLVTFRTEVLSRNADDHTVRLTYPQQYRLVDRRSEPRSVGVAGQAAIVNGSTAELLNLSAGGARVKTRLALRAGERIEVTLDQTACQGWALESIPDSLGTLPARNVRVRFETPLAGLVQN
jgi:hypothetical protein